MLAQGADLDQTASGSFLGANLSEEVSRADYGTT
jgi:hypothetical protein